MGKHAPTLITRTDADTICRHLATLYNTQRDLDAAKINAVARARRLGLSWDAIGAELNVSKQAAWERWHHLST